MPAPKHNGFTLIELSIVLVIIGLIVGGIMAGKALIQQAEIRAAAKQLQTMETAYNAFRLKYNCIAGDCLNATDFFGDNYIVVASGCPPSGGAGNGNGNGDGLIDQSSGLINNGTWVCEPTQAAKSLQLSNLLPTSLTTPCANAASYFKGINDGCAYFFKDDLYTKITAIKTNSITWSQKMGAGLDRPTLSPVQARLIDEKLDDGIPDKGKFRGMMAVIGGAWDADSCSTSGAYNLNEDFTCRALYYFK